MIDERHEENAALYALDLLEGDERVSFERSLAAEPELRALVRDLRAAAAALAHGTPAAAPSPFLRERVLASARTRQPAPARRQPMFAWAAAAGLALTTGLAGWQALRLHRELGNARTLAAQLQAENQQRAQELAAARDRQQQGDAALGLAQAELEKLRTTLRDDQAQSAQIIAALRSQANVAELKIQSLASLVGNTPQARAIAVWNPLTQQGVLTVANLPALEANKDYQLWLLEPQGTAPIDGGVFRVDATTGEARVTFKPSRAVRSVDKFAVSLERKGGAPTREGPVVLLGQ